MEKIIKMWHKKIKALLLFVILYGTFGCQGMEVLSNMGQGQAQSQGLNSNIFNEGKTYINLKKYRVQKGPQRQLLIIRNI
jgi:type II secretory pathway component PulL